MRASPPRGRQASHHFPSWNTDMQAVLDETALTQAFSYRRRRMEAASRLTDEMLAQVRTILDSDENTSYMMLLEEVMPVNNEATTTTQKVTDGAKAAGGCSVSFEEGTRAHPPEVVINDEINRKLQKIREMRIEHRNAAELRVKPAFQLHEQSMELPQPPTTYTSTSLAFALEALATCASKIVSATDGILVKVAVLDKTVTPFIFKEMNTLSLHSQHAWYCYSIVLQHLKQHEVCAKALQDATAQELSSMREQFLVRKEMLTAQEQKQKIAEEHLRALRLRLNTLDARCRMWSAMLLEGTPPFPIVVPLPIPQQRISLSRERESPAFIQSLSCHKIASTTPRVSNVGGAPARRMSSVRLHTPVLTNLDSLSSSSVSSLEEFSTRVDAMEVQVARFWTNPYVIKAQQCAERMRRNRHQKQEPSSTLVEVVRLPSISRKGSMQRQGSVVRHPSDVQLLSRIDNLYKGAYTSEANDKMTIEIRLMSLLRTLLRSATRVVKRRESVTTNTPSGATTPLGLRQDETEALEQDNDGGSAPVESPVTDINAPVEATSMTTDSAYAMVESIRTLLKFLEEAHGTAM